MVLAAVGQTLVLCGCSVMNDGFPAPAGETPGALPNGVVTIGAHVFNVEVADTRESQILGLMGRESLAPDAGMLFIFDQPNMQSFWMKDTIVPLDIAFIRSDLTISTTDTMEPNSLIMHDSIEPVPFVLEVLAGEFSRRGIAEGDAVSISLSE